MEKTKLCKHCKTEIDAAAKVCPNCRKKQGELLKVILIVVAVIIVLIAITGGEDNEENKTTSQNEVVEQNETVENNDSVTDEQNETVDNNENVETEEEKTSFTVGEIAENNFFKITYLSAEEYVSDNEYSQPKDGYTFYKVGFEVENKGSSDMYVYGGEFVGYADGYAVDQTYYFDEEGLSSANLSTGKKTKGYVFYEVPKDATSITIEYETSFWTNEKITFIVK